MLLTLFDPRSVCFAPVPILQVMTFVVVAGPTSCLECTIFTKGCARIGLSRVENCLTRIPSSCQATFTVHNFDAQPPMHTICLDGRTLHCQNFKKKFKRNDEVDRLAQIATSLQLHTPAQPGDVAVKGGLHRPRHKNGSLRTDTMTYFWVHTGYLGCPSLWGNERWDGCGAPWDHIVVRCLMCNSRHGTTVHKRLVRCRKWAPTFRQAWTQSWGPWAGYAEQWYDNAPPEDLHHARASKFPNPFTNSCLMDMGPTSRNA